MAPDFSLEVRPQIPAELPRLPEFANNLIYTWDRDLRALFRQSEERAVRSVRRQPQCIPAPARAVRSRSAARNPAYHGRLSTRRVVRTTPTTRIRCRQICARISIPKQDLVAYFCFEFGFHESLPLYCGGLGILAADHCKAASDLALPLVAVGLLYHQGFFEQHIDARGRQVEQYTTTQRRRSAARARNGRRWTRSHSVGADRRPITCDLRIWRGRAGHTTLYLLDSDLPENRDVHRSITHRLYGGDESTRVMQEIVLGIGGVRALHALGIKPTVWHLNEGHAAFQIIERCHDKMSRRHCHSPRRWSRWRPPRCSRPTHPWPPATTYFRGRLIEQHLGPYLRFDRLRSRAGCCNWGNSGQPDRVNMTRWRYAVRATRTASAGCTATLLRSTSATSGRRSRRTKIRSRHVTNGVHLQTFLALQWVNLFDIRFGDWRDNLSVPEYWSCIDTIPDHQFWSIRQELTAELFADVDKRMRRQHQGNGLASLHDRSRDAPAAAPPARTCWCSASRAGLPPTSARR